jgi:biotin carboxyl carrier protein
MRRIQLALFAALLLPFSHAQAQTHTLTWTPTIVQSGSPELFRVLAPPDAKVEGDWQGHPLQFFTGRSGKAWYALAGVDVEAAPGPAAIHVSIRLHHTAQQINTTIAIQPAHYRTTTITVPPKFVEPGPAEKKIIDAATEAKKAAFATSADHPLWSGSFRAPVPAAATDSFGTRRVYNGKLDGIHRGTDFRAHMGTPVRAGNSGIVVLAQALYYEGNCVILDHGLGLYSLSMHLSRIDVKPGDHVEKGQRIGLSGATGRVTGPHLHWAIRWQSSYIDPAKLLRLNLNALP